ncbi:MAG: class I SAM-dependent methyltransferase, partial [Planctomycetota bacterium]
MYEPKRRRIAMMTLFVLLVLAVGFVAVGAWVESAAVLQIFGVAFLALAVGFVGKLLVVSHVHIRGTAGRLEALNDRYDDTSRWLERFDADTRESFLAAKRRFGKVDAARSELEGKLDELAGDTPRLAAIKELGERLDAKVAELAKQSEVVSDALDTFKTEQVSSAEKAEQRASKTETTLTGKITELREEFAVVATLADRIELLETEVERFDALEKEVERVESHSSEQASKLIADGTAATRKAATDELEAAKAELTEQLKQLSGRVNKINDEHDRKRKSAVHAAREDLGATVTGLSKRVDNTAQLAGRQRGDGYVQFPRVLSEEAMTAASSFNAKVTPKHLKYLERKLQVIEGMCEGRLAGSVDDAVARALSAHMVRGKELRILEIGVLFGVGAAFLHHVLAPRHERVKLALLDPFQGYYGSDHLDPLTGLPVTRGAVERNMARCGISAEDVEILEGFSHEEAIQAAAEEAGPYHVIVIDGDHTMQGVRTDYEGYADMLRSGGLLV